MVKILMVCLGNICRSPVAQGLMEFHLNQLGIKAYVDSAGTSGWHDGAAPDPRSQSSTIKHGLSIAAQKSRKVTAEDFKRFDYIYAMDEHNLMDLLESSSPEDHHKIHLILDVVYPQQHKSVPDPYYSSDGFDQVYDLLDAACAKIAQNLHQQFI